MHYYEYLDLIMILVRILQDCTFGIYFKHGFITHLVRKERWLSDSYIQQNPPAVEPVCPPGPGRPALGP